MCVWALGAVFAVGAGLGALAQVELAEPGLQVVGRGDEWRYNNFISIHGLLFAISLPCVAIALCFAILADGGSWPFARSAAVFMLVAAVAGPVILGASIVGMGTQKNGSAANLYFDAMSMASVLFALLSLAALCGVAATRSAIRATALLFAVPSAMAAFLGFIIPGLPNRDTREEVASGGYLDLAADHALGVAILLCAIGAIACWAASDSGRTRLWFCLLSAAGIILASVPMLVATIGLDYSAGMPRRYVDYPATPSFMDGHAQLARAAAFFGAVLLAVVAWLGVIVIRRRPRADVEDVFD